MVYLLSNSSEECCAPATRDRRKKVVGAGICASLKTTFGSKDNGTQKIAQAMAVFLM